MCRSGAIVEQCSYTIAILFFTLQTQNSEKSGLFRFISSYASNGINICTVATKCFNIIALARIHIKSINSVHERCCGCDAAGTYWIK